MSTVTPDPREGESSPLPADSIARDWPAAAIETIKWILSDGPRSRRALAFLGTLLIATVALAWVLGPSLGGIIGSGVVGGGVGIGAALATRRRREV